MRAEMIMPSNGVHRVETRAPGSVLPDRLDRVDITYPVVESLGGEAGGGYDIHAAYLNAVASAWAYSDDKAMRLMLRKCGMELGQRDVELLRISNPAMLIDADAYIVAGSGVGMLVFRGTEIGGASYTDVLADAAVGLQRSSKGGVHSGFYRNLDAVWDYVREAMEQHFYQDGPDSELKIDKLYITGHSLGGALAVLAGERICSDGTYRALKDVLMGVYTYGQPMVGDGAFVAHCASEQCGLAARLFRHVNASDWVPRLPPWTTGPFRHGGQLYQSSSNGWSRSTSETRQAITTLISGGLAAAAFVTNKFVLGRALMRLGGFGFSLEDHLPEYYLEQSRRPLLGKLV